MIDLNRKVQPQSEQVKEITFLKAETKELSNGVKVHHIDQEGQSILKVEIRFSAGTIYQNKPLVASATNSLLVEGTLNSDSSEIAAFFDNEGAFLETSCTNEHASLVLYCLRKSLPTLLPKLIEILEQASFPEKELKNYCMVHRQKFLVNNEKVAYLAKKEFLPFLLGEQHAYSGKLELPDFDHIEREDVLDFYHSNYKDQAFNVYLSGSVDNEVLKRVGDAFSKIEVQAVKEHRLNLELGATDQLELNLERKNALQTAIRIGALSIGRQHEDFSKLYLANTILGGYFGSRLMNNIREDKGYTYGIGSGLIGAKHLAYFVISTEVGADVASSTIREIKKEMELLCEKEVGKEELLLVKNYVLGNLMRGFDGSFAAMDRFMMLDNLGLNYSYYERLVRELNEISPKDILETCRAYFRFDRMKKVMVGKV